jgi:hypothetical protein
MELAITVSERLDATRTELKILQHSIAERSLDSTYSPDAEDTEKVKGLQDTIERLTNAVEIEHQRIIERRQERATEEAQKKEAARVKLLDKLQAGAERVQGAFGDATAACDELSSAIADVYTFSGPGQERLHNRLSNSKLRLGILMRGLKNHELPSQWPKPSIVDFLALPTPTDKS